jgi:hypothetical protein
MKPSSMSTRWRGTVRTEPGVLGVRYVERPIRSGFPDVADFATGDVVEPGTGERADPGYAASMRSLLVARRQQDQPRLLVGIAFTACENHAFGGVGADQAHSNALDLTEIAVDRASLETLLVQFLLEPDNIGSP